jgi:N-acetylglucosaminyldiphosphoundecaprenol N-acetyl-beta-D-mannosaminyltransferase
MDDPICRIFGCRIDAVTMDEAVETIEGWIAAAEATCRYVVTPNVHHAALLRRDEGLRRAYAEAGLVLADGMPLVAAARLLHRPLPQRVAGSDLVPALFEHYRGRPLRVYLLGAAEGVAVRAAVKINERWPDVQVVGMFSPPLGFEDDPLQNEAILRSVADARPDVLVVGLGAPKQEVWVHSHRGEIQARAALCVGATIDFLAGHKRRAPTWMRRCGLEWLHRLASEPRRLGRRYLRDAWSFVGLLWREIW